MARCIRCDAALTMWDAPLCPYCGYDIMGGCKLHQNNPCTLCWVNHPTKLQTQFFCKIVSGLKRRTRRYKDKIYVYFKEKAK